MLSYNTETMKKKIVKTLVCLSAVVLIVFFVLSQVLGVKHSIRDELENGQVLNGSKELYRQTLDGAVGDDSYIQAIYSTPKQYVGFGAANPFKACQKDTRGCSEKPAWRQRSAFFANNIPMFIAGPGTNLPKPIVALYKKLAADKNTRCAVRNLTVNDGSFFSEHPDYDVLCVNRSLSVLEYEYVSRTDSKPFR